MLFKYFTEYAIISLAFDFEYCGEIGLFLEKFITWVFCCKLCFLLFQYLFALIIKLLSRTDLTSEILKFIILKLFSLLEWMYCMFEVAQPKRPTKWSNFIICGPTKAKYRKIVFLSDKRKDFVLISLGSRITLVILSKIPTKKCIFADTLIYFKLFKFWTFSYWFLSKFRCLRWPWFGKLIC